MTRPDATIDPFEDQLRDGLAVIADRASIERRPIDSMSASPRHAADGRPRRVWLVAASVALVLVLTAGVLLTRSPRTDRLDTTATTSTATSAPVPLPRFIPTYLPQGMAATEERLDDTRPRDPGWVTKWTRPDAVIIPGGVDRVTVEAAVPGQAGDQIVFGPQDHRWTSTPIGSLSSPRGLPHYQDGTPQFTDVNGRTAFVTVGVPAAFALNWVLEDGTVVRVSTTGLTFDEMLRATRSVRFRDVSSNGRGGRQPIVDPSSLPAGFTPLADGRMDVTGEMYGRSQLFGRADHQGGFSMRTVGRRFDPAELRWSLMEPVTELTGADGLRFLVSQRPELSSVQAGQPTVNTILGGRDDVTIRIEGALGTDELTKVALGLRVTAEPAPSPTPTTAPTDSGPPLAKGKVLFTKSSPDRRLEVTAKLIEQPKAGEPCESLVACNPGGPSMIFLEGRVEGRLHGGGGGGLPHEPASAIEPAGAGSGGAPPTDSISDVQFTTAPNVAKVTMDVRQLDNEVVTDEMVPVQGIVVFLAPEPGDFIGPAKAYDAEGNLVGTADPARSTLMPR